MNTSPLDRFAEQIAARKAEIDAEFAPKLRNHLIQLFRKAHAVEPGLRGVEAYNGLAILRGEYLTQGERDPGAHPDDQKPTTRDASDWTERNYQGLQPKRPEVAAFFLAVKEYEERTMIEGEGHLPYIDSITPADLEPNTAKRAAVWRARQSRA